MAIVRMHQAKDGSVHKTAAECAKHEVNLRLTPAIEKFVNNIKEGTPGLTDGADITSGMFFDLTALPAFLIENAEELRKLLNDALTTKKPRKAKDANAEKVPRQPRKSKPAAEPTAGPTTDPQPEAKPEEKAATPVEGGVDELLAELGAS
jgi:hypothetical protein